MKVSREPTMEMRLFPTWTNKIGKVIPAGSNPTDNLGAPW